MTRNIAIIAPAYPLRGGLSAPTERLAREFRANGHRVKIYTFSLQYPKLLFPGKTQLSPDPPPNDLDIEAVVNSINPFNWLSVGRRIRREKYDAVVIRFWIPFMAPCLGTIAGILRKKTKVVAILDNVIPHERRFGDMALIKYFLKSCDAFLAMSKQVVDDLLKFRPNSRYALVPFPVYDNYGEKVSKAEACQRLRLNEHDRYILFFGFIRRYKGLDLLLEAMKDERIREANIRLIVAGEFYDDRKNYDIPEDVILFSDYIPEQEVKYFFGAADIVVQPYRTATQSGISQIAFHFEKPMIVTNVGGLPEIVRDGETGFVVNPSSKEIANAILAFFQQDLKEKFTREVKTEKNRYSWSNHVEAILGFLKSE